MLNTCTCFRGNEISPAIERNIYETIFKNCLKMAICDTCNYFRLPYKA